MVAVIAGTGVLLNTQDRRATGEHFAHRFDFDIAQAAGLKQCEPVLVAVNRFSVVGLCS